MCTWSVPLIFDSFFFLLPFQAIVFRTLYEKKDEGKKVTLKSNTFKESFVTWFFSLSVSQFVYTSVWRAHTKRHTTKLSTSFYPTLLTDTINIDLFSATLVKTTEEQKKGSRFSFALFWFTVWHLGLHALAENFDLTLNAGKSAKWLHVLAEWTASWQCVRGNVKNIFFKAIILFSSLFFPRPPLKVRPNKHCL